MSGFLFSASNMDALVPGVPQSPDAALAPGPRRPPERGASWRPQEGGPTSARLRQRQERQGLQLELHPGGQPPWGRGHAPLPRAPGAGGWGSRALGHRQARAPQHSLGVQPLSPEALGSPAWLPVQLGPAHSVPGSRTSHCWSIFPGPAHGGGQSCAGGRGGGKGAGEGLTLQEEDCSLGPSPSAQALPAASPLSSPPAPSS